MKDLLLFTWNTPPRKPDELQQDTQASNGIIPLTFFSEEGAGRSSRRSASSTMSQWKCPLYFYFVARRKKRVPKREQRPIRKKISRQVRLSWSHIHLHNRLGQPLLLSRTRYQERRTPSFKIGTGSDKLETKWINWVRAGVLSISLNRRALS